MGEKKSKYIRERLGYIKVAIESPELSPYTPDCICDNRRTYRPATWVYTRSVIAETFGSGGFIHRADFEQAACDEEERVGTLYN